MADEHSSAQQPQVKDTLIPGVKHVIAISSGWSTISQRHFDLRMLITAIASIIAQPKCNEGIAAIWLAAPSMAFFG